jgi:tRNA 5-methylaminomethyl-2-thiouridine biosynthesis bifunctional protein
LWSAEVFGCLARLANADATFATYTSAGGVKRALAESGFEYRKMPGFGFKRAMLAGKLASR